MRKKRQKGRCVKRVLPKCEGVCRTFDTLQEKYADMLESDEDIVEYQCNVPIESEGWEDFTTDFVCRRSDGELAVRECVYRNQLLRTKTAEMLGASQKYWWDKGVTDWKLVIDARKEMT